MDVASTRFGDLYKSALGKAGRLGGNVGGVTLGPNAVPFRYEEAVEMCEGPQGTSTPKKSVRLSIPAMRHYFEIKSKKDVERKTLLAEETKTRKRESDMLVVNLETAAKVREEGTVRRLARLYEEGKLRQSADIKMLEKRLESKMVKKNDGLDRVAETRAHLRSEKIRQSVEDAKRAQISEKIKEDAKRKIMENKKKLLEAAAAWEETFYVTYKQILKTVQDSPYQKSLYEVMRPYMSSMKSFNQFVENFEAKAKNGDLVEDDLKSADVVLKNLKKILNLVTTESEKILAAAIEEQKRADEEQRLRIEKEKVANEQCLKFSDEASLQTFADLRQLLLKAHQDLEPLVKNKQMDDYRFQLHKAASVPINAISSDSPQHMMDKYRRLFGLMSGSRVEGCHVTANDHPLGGLFIKELVAKLFVQQAEKVVSTKPEHAYAVASILVNLWTEFPDFGQLVRAHFFDKCPYLVPAFLPRLEGQTDEEYFKSMGYHVRNDKIEDIDMFLKRMEGIMRVYASVLITQPRKPDQQSPLGLAEAWRWCCAFLNLDPRPDIAPVMLVSFLEVTGHEMFRSYGKQFKKILAYVCKDYLPLLEQNTPVSRRGPLTRFETFLEKAVKTGDIPRPTELLAPNFW